MAKLNTYPLQSEVIPALQLLGIVPGTGDAFDTVRLTNAALVELIQSIVPSGKDGREVELRKGSTALEWRYVGDVAWTSLVPLADIQGEKGAVGDKILLRKTSTAVQWSYESTGNWTDLVLLTEITGTNGTNGKTMLPTTGVPSGAMGVDGDFANDPTNSVMYGPKAGGSWPAGVSYKGAKGDAGTGLVNKGTWVAATYQPGDYVFSAGSASATSLWVLIGNTPYVSSVQPKNDTAHWAELAAPPGENGVDGKSVELQKTATAIQWRQTPGGTWVDLVQLVDLKGNPGDTGPAGKTLITVSGAPANDTGTDGDYAIDPAAQLMYGPKAAGAWPAGISYKGNPGNDGVTPSSTDVLTEGVTNLYFTAARVRSAVLTGLSLASGAVVAATDTVLGAIGKLQQQMKLRATDKYTQNWAANPTFDNDGTLNPVNTTNYSVSFVDRSAVGVPAGMFSPRVGVSVKKVAAQSGQYDVPLVNGLGYIPVVPGQQIDLSIELACTGNLTTGNATARIVAVERDASGAALFNTRVLSYDNVAGGVQFLAGTYTASAGVYRVTFGVWNETAMPVDGTIYFGSPSWTIRQASTEVLNRNKLNAASPKFTGALSTQPSGSPDPLPIMTSGYSTGIPAYSANWQGGGSGGVIAANAFQFSTGSLGPTFVGSRSYGTPNTHGAVASGRSCMTMLALSSDGAAYQPIARMDAYTEEATTSTNAGGEWQVWTTPIAANRPVLAARFRSNGNFEPTGAVNEGITQTVGSAATVNLATTTSNTINITGSTTITALGTLPAGVRRQLRFVNSVQVTHNASSLKLPGGASITMSPDDILDCTSLGAGAWTCRYTKASGIATLVTDANAPVATDSYRIGSGGANLPIAEAGTLDHVQVSASNATQEFISQTSGRVFYRYLNTTWSAWKEMVVAAGVLPAGGTTGQVLSKKSATDGDVQWTTPAAGGGSGGGINDLIALGNNSVKIYELGADKTGTVTIWCPALGTLPIGQYVFNTKGGTMTSYPFLNSSIANLVSIPTGTTGAADKVSVFFGGTKLYIESRLAWAADMSVIISGPAT